jgi:hypothetical protein
VIGTVTRQTVIDAYNRRRVFQADPSGGFGSLLDAVHEGRTMEVLGGVHMGADPLAASGRT